MTDDQQLELRQIRAEQEALRAQWSGLEARLRTMEAASGTAPAPTAAAPPLAAALAPPAKAPPPLPKSAPTPPASTAASPPPARESLEMRIGSTWLVRAAIVLLLTSLVFAGNYLYRNIVPHLGPGLKVALLYAAAATLTGLGAWLERSRQAREITRLQTYARVVLAGGLAAIYYVTYAAHYFPNLRVVESAFVAGVLLLAWTAFMVWLADRRNSEILATFAILLAYYTSAINEVASFTLWSNLILTVGAVYLLRRHLWRIFPFATLLATFGSYAFWRLAQQSPGAFPFYGEARLGAPLWIQGSFVSLYWALFTGAVLTSGERLLSPGRRASFVSLNNGAYFLLMTWLLAGTYPFWRWALVFGVVLLAISEVVIRLLPQPLDAATRGAYRGLGLLAVTLSIIAYFSGWHLTLMLAAETVLLAVGACQGESALVLAGAMLCGAVTTAAVVVNLVFEMASAQPFAGLDEVAFNRPPWVVDASIGGFLLSAGWWCRRVWEKRSQRSRDGESERQLDVPTRWSKLLAGAPAYFALLSVTVWLFLLWDRVTDVSALAPAVAAAALALLGLGEILRIGKLSWYAQAYLLAAQGGWIIEFQPPASLPPVWNILALVGATVIFGCSWKWLTEKRHPGVVRPTSVQPFYILILVLGTLCGWRYLSGADAGFKVGAFTIAARWSFYAAGVFALGLLVHERVYRWLGLGILCVTLLRVIFVDLWELDLLERALSFLTLGIVLLVIGFFYNRFSAKLRDLL